MPWGAGSAQCAEGPSRASERLAGFDHLKRKLG